MRYSHDDLNEALGDLMQIFEGQLTFVQLAVRKNLIDNFLNKSLNPGSRGISQSTGSRLHGICQ
jgi:uncharacterized protein YejL (UPF0352 family)